MTDSNAYPTAKKGEETVRDVLLASTDERVHLLARCKSVHRVLPLRSEKEHFDDFLLRTSGLYTTEHKQALRKAILEEDAVSFNAPDKMFIGPKVSQPLLRLSSLEDVDLGNRALNVEIVPKHDGITLKSFLSKNKAAGAEELMQHFIHQPDELRDLFEQAALVGMQGCVRPFPDIIPRNVMVNKTQSGALEVSLIDVVPTERSYDDDKCTSFAQSLKDSFKELSDTQIIGLNYIKGHDRSMSTLCIRDIADAAEQGPTKDAFTQLCHETVHATETSIRDNTLQQKHPQWTGFKEVEAIKAIPMTAPSWVLREELNKLYAQAVPEQDAAR